MKTEQEKRREFNAGLITGYAIILLFILLVIVRIAVVIYPYLL